VTWDENQSVGDLFDKSCKQFAARPAFHCMGKTLSFAQIDKMSRDFAAWVQSKGLPKGARVAIMMPNCLQYPAVLFGTLRAGYTVVNVNPLYTARELEHQLRDSGAEAIVILENFAATLEQVIARTAVKHVVVASIGDLLGSVKGAIVNLVVRKIKKIVPAYALPGALGFHRMLSDAASLRLRPVEMDDEDIAFLQYTGGTTGVSKGAMLTHGNIVSNLLQTSQWWGHRMKEGGE